MSLSVETGLSLLRAAASGSDPPPAGFGASPLPSAVEAGCVRVFCRLPFTRLAGYLPLRLHPSSGPSSPSGLRPPGLTSTRLVRHRPGSSADPIRGTVRAFGEVRPLGLTSTQLVSSPHTPSADFCTAVRQPYGGLSPLLGAGEPHPSLFSSRGTRDHCGSALGRTRCRSPEVSPAAFLAHPLDLQPRPLDGYGLRGSRPARPDRTASYPVSVRQVASLLHTSSGPHLAVTPLC